MILLKSDKDKISRVKKKKIVRLTSSSIASVNDTHACNVQHGVSYKSITCRLVFLLLGTELHL